jgi:ribosomal protein L37AE/L43A
MQLENAPVCPETTEESEFVNQAWKCKKSGLEMGFENNQWVCEQCGKKYARAGKQVDVQKPQSPTESEIQKGIRQAREEFERRKIEDAEKLEQERKNYSHPRD